MYQCSLNGKNLSFSIKSIVVITDLEMLVSKFEKIEDNKKS